MASSTDRYEVVAQVDDERILNLDVINYVEYGLVTPLLVSLLKAKSAENGSTFEEEREKLIQHSFQAVLKKITLMRVIQKEAIQKNQRRFFNLTTQELDKKVHDQILHLTRSSIQEGVSEEEGKKELILKLREIKQLKTDLTDSEVWSYLINSIKFNTVERYREQETLRFLCSLGRCETESPSKILSRNLNRLKRNHFVRISLNDKMILNNSDSIDYLATDVFNFKKTNDLPVEDTSPRRFIFLGEIINNRVELRHINDWDITSGLAPMLVGYPETDDQGRTSGLNASYEIRGTNGSLAIELENFLFSRKVSSSGHVTSQEIEEDSSLRIVSRHFVDEAGKKWILMGVSAGHRTQSAGIHSFIQAAFHTLNPKTSDREILNWDQTNLFVQGLLGIGGKYSLLDTKYVDLVITGEAFVSPTVGLSERSSFTTRSSIDLNISGSYEDYPLLSIGLFGEYSFLLNGSQESVIGGKVSIGKVFRSIYYQASLYIIKWDRDLDRVYEGGSSWTTGVSVSATFINKRPKVDYVLN